MNMWKEKIRLGNINFDMQHWQQAETAYLEASEELEQAWFANLEDTHLMMAWIANMHNLAKLYELTGHPEQSSMYLLKPYKRILILLNEKSFPQKYQDALKLAMRSAITPLLEFCKHHPICKCCQKELNHIHAWLSNSGNIEHTNKNLSPYKNTIVAPYSLTTTIH